MSQRSQLLNVIELDLLDDLRDFDVLIDLMASLYNALLARHCEEITLVNERIKPLLDAVGARARRRSRVLAAFGLTASSNGLHTLIGYCAPARKAHLLGAWEALASSVERCRDLNERNGKLLAMHGDILQQMLNPVPGQLYSPSI